jgi:hypothetical protein
MSAEGSLVSTQMHTAARDPNEGDPFGNQDPGHWYFVPGRSLRNDGVARLTLYPCHKYTLAHDGTGWLVWVEFERPHRYLVDDAGDHVSSLPGTEGEIMLVAGQEYGVTQDGQFGPWRVCERVSAGV